MANERLRDALMHAGHSTSTAADQVGVDAKTVERWLTQDRVPYPRHRGALAALVGRSESYLWPAAVPAQRQKKAATSEIVQTFPHRATCLPACGTTCCNGRRHGSTCSCTPGSSSMSDPASLPP